MGIDYYFEQQQRAGEYEHDRRMLIDRLNEVIWAVLKEHPEPGNEANRYCQVCRSLVRGGDLIEKLTGRRP